MRPHRKEALNRERDSLASQVERWFDVPMTVLGLVWLVLLILEFTRGLTPALQALGETIWVIFVLEFAVRLVIAPHKGAFLRNNVLNALSLVLPALRVLRMVGLVRILRAGRAARGLRLFRLVARVNRGMRALSTVMSRRGMAYVIATTVLVAFGGAAGIYAFERNSGGEGLNTYGAALWWTLMLLTTMGSGYWPETPEGRILCFFLAPYGFGIFGYVTAALASFFVARDASTERAEVAGKNDIRRLRQEIRGLRADLHALKR